MLIPPFPQEKLEEEQYPSRLYYGGKGLPSSPSVMLMSKLLKGRKSSKPGPKKAQAVNHHTTAPSETPTRSASKESSKPRNSKAHFVVLCFVAHHQLVQVENDLVWKLPQVMKSSVIRVETAVRPFATLGHSVSYILSPHQPRNTLSEYCLQRKVMVMRRILLCDTPPARNIATPSRGTFVPR